MTNQHPITPPPELVQQWRYAASNVPASLSTDPGGRQDYIDYIATQAARWGADQEWLILNGHCQAAGRPNTARRPQPQPSLKDQALEMLGPEPLPVPGEVDECTGKPSIFVRNAGTIEAWRVIRAALEQLP